MLETLLYTGLGDFFGSTITTMYGSTFWVGMMFIAMVAFLLIKINSPAPLTLMISVLLFAVLGGFTNPWIGVQLVAVSSVFFPVFVLVLLITGAVFAYALWRMFGS